MTIINQENAQTLYEISSSVQRNSESCQKMEEMARVGSQNAEAVKLLGLES